MPENPRFSPLDNHNTVRAALNKLVKKGELTEAEALEIYKAWKLERKISIIESPF